ncbi:hypothetical protein [Chryseolinea lacunae]|uniref:Uncharacterized protein n=1 Tax=Chryseolinea lacunae TaxID=2801331 RepID=A0ABS1L2M5_9BACT|nr:hypothetical protein [Chryseolinea lacunae]MBL0745964.1 hypothetical protein [Chryseolinea lacunae]
MTIQMEHDDSPVFSRNQWDLAFVGDHLDDRGTEAAKYVNSVAKSVMKIVYSANEFEFIIDGNTVSIDDLPKHLSQYINGSILLEATTMGFVEILTVLNALKIAGSTSFSILYLEPGGYKRKSKSLVMHRREFDLSGEVLGYKAIPGFSKILSDEIDQQVVFFVGFESSRLDRAMEDYQMINPKQCVVVFGVPAFKSGWEIDSFANNIGTMNDRKISGGIHYCGANNPLSAYVALEEIKSGIQKNESMFVAPIGTKPTSIGTALFAINNPNIGVLYDHPTKDRGRTKEILSWNLYNIEIN